VSEIVMDADSDSTTGSNQNPSNPGNTSNQQPNRQSK
jgi:hypothetical protein